MVAADAADTATHTTEPTNIAPTPTHTPSPTLEESDADPLGDEVEALLEELLRLFDLADPLDGAPGS